MRTENNNRIIRVEENTASGRWLCQLLGALPIYRAKIERE
jgi:hypothetical protein